MIEIAETIVHCALNREESRGAHQRRDFPKRDDQRFLCHSVVSRTAEGPPRIDYLPVVITRWPPGERIYGRDH
jgi:fumarate reductase flavoprotein subunit